MKRKNRVILLAGVALAVVAFLGVLALGSLRGAPEPPPIETVAVVTAATDLPLGTQLTIEMLGTDERPLPQAAGSFQSADELVGSVIRRSVPRGHVLRTSDFETGAAAADIANLIGPGLRGVAVALNQVDGVGYLVQPGDYVDVVLTTDSTDSPLAIPNPLYPSQATEPFLLLDGWVNNTSVKVLVQNVQLVALVTPPPRETTNSQPAPQDPLVAVLAVSPQQVELVRFAQRSGGVSLAMRSPHDRTTGDVQTSGITLRELVERHGVLPPLPVQP